ncbi:alpha/beta hydrolase [Kitasatospora sp. SUK 42]|uniref:alpha/beta hydrolase n=1 Tax=Kitasatospora sp. SUK 42 TaxID=1588882 RepID=UPI0018CAEC25|nr:alpha/beta hydrolase [Kitasatospora sp. SUK 42]MBV2152688.1 alpha/beta hydrolase [Kitasatospora sp. SUK 42]
MDPARALIRTALNPAARIAPGLAGRAAFELFQHPLRRSRVRPAEQEVHRRAVLEPLAVGGKTVVGYRWGGGERPVLVLHGWRSRASRFAPYVPRLRALGLSVLSFDAPGHGDSGGNATSVLEFHELALQLQDRYGPFEAVIAHSLGVCAAFGALADGLRADRLAAVAGVSEVGFFPAAFCAGLGLNPAVERALRGRIERGLFAGDAGAWERYDAARQAAVIGLPVLVLHDEGDDVVPLRQAHRLQRAYGERLDLVVTRGLGHRRIIAEPTVVDQVIGFISAGQEVAAGS